MKASVALAALALSGCVHLSAVTTAPPTRTADLDDEHESIRVSAGAALGFECSYHNGFFSGPCPEATAKIDDSNVAKVYPAYLDELTYELSRSSTTQQIGFVIVGIRPGSTILRITTNGTHDEFVVNVIE
jgi:hypothetical protein